MVADLLEVSVTADGVGKFICTQPRSPGLLSRERVCIFTATLQKMLVNGLLVTFNKVNKSSAQTVFEFVTRSSQAQRTYALEAWGQAPVD